MSDSDNGKDCKHEVEIIVEYDDWGYFCKKCDDEIADVVIRTKAYDQAREDVIAAGEAYVESCNDEGENGDYQLWCELRDALKVGK